MVPQVGHAALEHEDDLIGRREQAVAQEAAELERACRLLEPGTDRWGPPSHAPGVPANQHVVEIPQVSIDAEVGQERDPFFLDLAGHWDPSLAFVMAGAVTVGAVAFAVANRRARSFLGAEMRLPSARHIDRRLVLGSALFGIGWGVAGFCPGPALVALGMGEVKALVVICRPRAVCGA